MKTEIKFVPNLVQGLYSNLDPETDYILLKQKLEAKKDE